MIHDYTKVTVSILACLFGIAAIVGVTWAIWKIFFS